MNEFKTGGLTLPRPLAAIALCSMLAIGLQGCFGLIAGGTLVGTFAATDRRTLGAQVEDKAILVKGETGIPRVVASGSHVNVTSFNRKVLLTGEVPDEASKAAAEREIKSLTNVADVFNELVIAGASSLSARSADAIITGKVLASLVDDRDLSAHAFKITTERGIVYMMGRVTEREGRRGSRIASGVKGVQKVVTLYEYIPEEELGQYARQAPPAPAK